jgi:hypothetical protein
MRMITTLNGAKKLGNFKLDVGAKYFVDNIDEDNGL